MAAETKSKKLKTAAQLAALEAKASEEKFPGTLAESYKLLAEVKEQPVKDEDEGDARAARITALSAHIAKLGQGLPHVPSKSGDFNHQHMTATVLQMKLDRLARTNPEIKELLAAKTATEKRLAAVLAAVAAAEDLTALKETITKI